MVLLGHLIMLTYQKQELSNEAFG